MSKELTPLEALENIVVDLTPHLKEANKEEINIIEKSLKALEIIKNKRVDVNDLFLFVSLKAYNDFVCYCDDSNKRKLAKKEYDLLKEVLL